MGKESAKCLLTYVEDLLSNMPLGNFARTFRDGSKVFIMQQGANAHGSFLMISELVHGRWKGSIIVPEGKLGSGWRGFGFHLRKAIAPNSLTIKPPAQSTLNLIGQQLRHQKSFLSAMVGGDRKDKGGSKLGKHLMPSFQNSNISCLSSQFQDSRYRGVGKENPVLGADIVLGINANAFNGTTSPLTLELSLCLECGLNGKWEVKHSSIQEVGRSNVGPTQVFRPTVLSKAYPPDPSRLNSSKPKPTLVWWPKSKDLNSLSFLIRESQPPGKSLSLPSASTPSTIEVLCSNGVLEAPTTSLMSLMAAAAQSHDSDKVDDARYVLSTLSDLNHASDVVEAELLGSDEADEAKEISPSDVEDNEPAPIDSDGDAASSNDPTDEDDDSKA
ncbi:hypothetical protein SO802_029200 [Lithocarpus litseifolius]|uniref:Uncharacterized protein n=1 Tax=Lithocarpus litseifolius TaxID=425828 RepID=A0AAW2BUF5_9ROSI